MPERARGNWRDHISRRGPEPQTRLQGWRCCTPLRLSAEQKLTGRRAKTQSSHLTLLPPPSGLRPPKLIRGAFTTRPNHATGPDPVRVRAHKGRRNVPRAPSWVWHGEPSHTGELPQGCRRRVANPANAAKLLKRRHLMQGVGEKGE